MQNNDDFAQNAPQRYWSPAHDYWTDFPSHEYLPPSLEGRYYQGRNLMIPPWKNEDPESIGLTDAQLDAHEKAFGLPLPALYREHLKRQNGGYFRYESYLDEDKQLHSLFINSAKFDSEIPGKYTPVAEVFDYIDPDDWANVFGENPHLERLYVLSYMYGHSVLLLDYGCGDDKVKPEPEVCLLEIDFNFTEVFRAPSYADFIKNMVYGETEWFLGLKSTLNLDELAKVITRRLLSTPGCEPMTRREDDRQGWYNYDAWYTGTLYGKDGNALFFLLPNQNRIGTYTFSDDADCPYILVVDPRRSDIYATHQVERSTVENILRKLEADAVPGGLEMRFILPG